VPEHIYVEIVIKEKKEEEQKWLNLLN
jgi:hypothetical protein